MQWNHFLVVLALSGSASFLRAATVPSVPGFQVEVYATVQNPVRLAIDPLSGTLYLGRDEGSNGADPERIWRVGRDRSAKEYGPPIADPDAVLFDSEGKLSGIPGAVIVGGSSNAGAWWNGTLYAIPPGSDSAVTLCNAQTFSNISDLAWASGGSPVISDDGLTTGWVKAGCTASLLATVSGRPGNVEVDAQGRILLRQLYGGDGSIRRFLPGGSLDKVFQGFGNGDLLVVGRGGAWGEYLYANVAASGDLLRIDPANGTRQVIGSGFTGRIMDGAFGPDGTLYVVDYTGDRVLRICPTAGPPIEFSDSDFQDQDWEVISLTTGGGGVISAVRDGSDGNPDSFRRITNVTQGSAVYTNLFGFHRRIGAVHDPRTGGAIASLDYSEDFVCFDNGGGDCQATGPALRQGGQVYVLDGHRAYHVTLAGSWTPLALTGLGALDFIRLDPAASDPDDFSRLEDHPDFSQDGKPIELGFFRANSTGSSGVWTTEAGIDNWRVALHACALETRQVPGDCNQDGRLDISDAVCIFRTLFMSDPARFPCGDGSAGDAANLALLDWQGDGALDISDGVAILEHLFRDGPPHVRSGPFLGGSACIPIPGCRDVSFCGLGK